jgi:F-type H+-transporting ATPase subunit a
MAELHVSISAEKIFQVAGISVTNSMITGVIVSCLLILLAFSFFSTKKTLYVKSRFQNLIEMLVEGLYNLTRDIAGEKKARLFFPFIITSFLFILLNNWAGLIPGVGTIGKYEEEPAKKVEAMAKPNSTPVLLATTENIKVASDTNTKEVAQNETVPSTQNSAESKPVNAEHSKRVFVPFFRAATADLNTTIALALISVFLTQFYGVKFLGLSYFTKFFNFKQGPIFTFVGILELVSEIAKIISFAFRLFGNIFAGEVLLAVIGFLVPVIAPIPFLGMEIFVGTIQALVFAMLSLVFINMATMGHEEH